MTKETLAVFTLLFAAIIAGLTLIGYGLHMFNTLQFFVGMIVSFVIGGACIDLLFFAEERMREMRTQYNIKGGK